MDSLAAADFHTTSFLWKYPYRKITYYDLD